MQARSTQAAPLQSSPCGPGGDRRGSVCGQAMPCSSPQTRPSHLSQAAACEPEACEAHILVGLALHLPIVDAQPLQKVLYVHCCLNPATLSNPEEGSVALPSPVKDPIKRGLHLSGFKRAFEHSTGSTGQLQN